MAALAEPDTEIYAVWDDDDIYLPWYLTASVAALADGDVAVPSACWNLTECGLEFKPTNGLFHAGWSYWRAAFERVGGYPDHNSGEDQLFAERIHAVGLRLVDPCRFAPPGFLHRWDVPTLHLSSLPRSGYKPLAREPLVKTTSLTPHWDRDWVEEISRVRRDVRQGSGISSAH